MFHDFPGHYRQLTDRVRRLELQPPASGGGTTPAWVDLTSNLRGGSSPSNPGWAPADSTPFSGMVIDGMVFLRGILWYHGPGAVDNGALGLNLAASLPAQFRPANKRWMTVATDSGTSNNVAGARGFIATLVADAVGNLTFEGPFVAGGNMMVIGGVTYNVGVPLGLNIAIDGVCYGLN